MSKRTGEILTSGKGLVQLPIGTRINVPTREDRRGIDIIPDPEGKFVVTSCESGLVKFETFEDS